MALDATFDLDRLHLPLTAAELPPAAPPAALPPATRSSTRRRRPQSPLLRHQPGEHFLKGPIPMAWLNIAMCLPGKALHVAVAIWQRAGMANSGTIKLNLSKLSAHGVTHSAASRGLDALARAGLVTVVRQKGQSPEITLCDAPTAAGPAILLHDAASSSAPTASAA